MKVVVQPVISLSGVVNLAGEVNVSSVMRVRAVSKLREGTPTNMIAELVGKNGEVVARAPVVRTDAHGSGCGCGGGHDHGGHGSGSTGFAFHALLSDVEPGSALRLVKLNDEDPREHTEVWSRKPTGAAPKVRKVTTRVEKGEVVIRWDCRTDRGQSVEYSIQFSKDRGKSWNGLTVALRESEYRTPVSELPSGSVVFRVLAHDGFFTASSDAKALRLAARPPVVSIVHPYRWPQVPGWWAAASLRLGRHTRRRGESEARVRVAGGRQARRPRRRVLDRRTTTRQAPLPRRRAR